VIAFTALMFSPINFPIERLPDWLQSLHLALPLYHMAEVMRASLANETFHAEPISYVVLVVWAVLGFLGAIRFLERA
ncbi:MAG: ABC transporter, partial [Micrococcales bacterium]